VILCLLPAFWIAGAIAAFFSKQAVISGQSVGNNFLVDMADMNRVVGIVNGGGYVKFVVHERNFNLK